MTSQWNSLSLSGTWNGDIGIKFILTSNGYKALDAVMRIRDPQDPHFFESKDPGSGSWGINLRKNLLKFIADILLMRANL